MADDLPLETISLAKPAPGDPPVKVETAGPAEPAKPKESILRPRRDNTRDAAAAAADQIKNANAEAQAARERAERAERVAADSQAQLRNAGNTLLAQRAQAINDGIDTAKSLKASATAALRAARETGDFEAETRALDDIGKANFDLNRLGQDKDFVAVEIERAKAAPPVRTDTGREPGRGAAADAWIRAHPMYNTDDEYQAQAGAAHNLAVKRGIQINSPAYFDFLEARLEQVYGKGHGVPDTHGRTRDDDAGSRRSRDAGSVGMRPGGTTDGSTGGMPGERTIRTEIGTFQLANGSDGKPIVRMSPETRKDFEDAAKWTNMSLPEYIQIQIDVAQEREGGFRPPIQSENIAVYR